MSRQSLQNIFWNRRTRCSVLPTRVLLLLTCGIEAVGKVISFKRKWTTVSLTAGRHRRKRENCPWDWGHWGTYNLFLRWKKKEKKKKNPKRRSSIGVVLKEGSKIPRFWRGGGGGWGWGRDAELNSCVSRQTEGETDNDERHIKDLLCCYVVLRTCK